MKKLTNRLPKWGLATLAIAVAGIAIGAGAAEYARNYVVEGPAASQLFVFPGGNLNNDGDVARLNTQTGEVFRYRGALNNPNVRGTWELRVAKVKEAHSGMLEIQRLAFPTLGADDLPEADVATFLVDVVNGTTWILRDRASTNGTWDLIDFAPRTWGH